MREPDCARTLRSRAATAACVAATDDAISGFGGGGGADRPVSAPKRRCGRSGMALESQPLAPSEPEPEDVATAAPAPPKARPARARADIGSEPRLSCEKRILPPALSEQTGSDWREKNLGWRRLSVLHLSRFYLTSDSALTSHLYLPQRLLIPLVVT